MIPNTANRNCRKLRVNIRPMNHTFRGSCDRLVPLREKLGQNREGPHWIPLAGLGLVVDDISRRAPRKIFKCCSCARQKPVPSVPTWPPAPENVTLGRE